jgi:hypothetical protein
MPFFHTSLFTPVYLWTNSAILTWPLLVCRRFFMTNKYDEDFQKMEAEIEAHKGTLLLIYSQLRPKDLPKT